MLERRAFGSTGHLSSRVIFGAAALGAMSPPRAEATLTTAVEAGINHIDTAASYGRSEELLRPFLDQHRHEVFLATKTGERTATRARAELERSLDRLGVETIDLIQLHNLVEPEELDAVHERNGAVSALIAARDEGLVRFIGITGHGLRIPRAHLVSLDRFPFDSVLVPWNHVLAANDTYRGDAQHLFDVCTERGVAIQTIKSVARRRWTEGDMSPHYAWYEPLPSGEALDRAVGFVLADDRLFLNSSSDARLLGAILAAAHNQVEPDDEDLRNDRRELDMTPLFDGERLERI
jgi:aryl-alcohol dehydrogenase-like predicted oxidoreductase